ncbi:cupredoxin domain-containing protein [Patescibacteria group bacterium]|nr:cupredoxin domain-containing protein [Patescibacteria group bacterium]
MNKMIALSILLTVFAIGGMVFLLRGNENASPVVSTGTQTNVAMVDGKQVIQINAKGGYVPRNTIAKANTPTVLNVQTNGTFDCSSALTVPAVGFRKNLPASGVTPIEIPPQQPGTTIKGVCAMGMYSFAVNFN